MSQSLSGVFSTSCTQSNPQHANIQQLPMTGFIYYGYMAIEPTMNNISEHTVYKSSFYIPPHNDTIQKHLYVWRMTNDEWSDDAYLRQRLDTTNGSNCYLYFYNEDDLFKFEEWWKNYSSYFIDIMNHKYPYPKSGEISGYMVTTDFDILSDVTFTEWQFIVKNIKKLPLRVLNGWVFDNQEDATLFKLMGEK